MQSTRLLHRVSQVFRQVDAGKLLVVQSDQFGTDVLQRVHVTLALAFARRFVEIRCVFDGGRVGHSTVMHGRDAHGPIAKLKLL